jgi:hypothetical protein
VRDKPYTGSPSLSNSSRQFQAVDDGHVDVRQDYVGDVQIHFIEGLRCAIGDPNIVAEQGQQFSYRICYIDNVIDDEDVGHRSSLNTCTPLHVAQLPASTQ